MPIYVIKLRVVRTVKLGKAIISPDIQCLQLVAAANQASQSWIFGNIQTFQSLIDTIQVDKYRTLRYIQCFQCTRFASVMERGEGMSFITFQADMPFSFFQAL